jgi:hypothetical protein
MSNNEIKRKPKKGTMAAAELKLEKSKTPRVDDLVDTRVLNSPRYCYDLKLLAQKLEIELAEEKLKSQRLEKVIEYTNVDVTTKSLNDGIMKREKREHTDRPTRFDQLTNFEVMQKLRKFGFGRSTQ